MKVVLPLLAVTLPGVLYIFSYVREYSRFDIDRKYSPASSSRPTVTPRYTDYPESSNFSAPVIDESSPIFDPTYLYSNFSLDDTDYLYSAKLQLDCLPRVFGYSAKRGKKVFPDYKYPPCTEKNKGVKPTILVNGDVIELTCPDDSTPSYLLQPLESLHTLQSKGQMSSLWDIKTYTSPITVTKEEFVLAKCGNEKFRSFHYAPRFNQKAYQEAQTKAKTIGHYDRPQVILLLTIDSYSRRHFYRKMPQTVEYLRSLQNSEFEVYDFKLHNVVGGNSVENMIPMLGNSTEVKYTKKFSGDFLGKDGLWNIFKNAGYMTLVGFESCDHYFLDTLGKRPKADHLVRSFFCATDEHLHMTHSKSAKLHQRCIGDRMSHYYLLNYTYSFTKLYPDMNQWIYIHSDAAHEGTGLHAITLDKDLVEFLKQYVEEISVTHDVVILLHADHGMRYGHWFTEIEGYQEHKLPAMFVIASKNVLAKYPQASLALHHNSLALTTKKDMRATMLSLMYLPYNNTLYDRQLDHYSSKFIDFFQDFAPTTRTCQSAGIPLVYCSCLNMQEIDSVHLDRDSDTELSLLIRNLAEEAVYYMNSRIQLPEDSEFSVCQRLEFDKVVKAWGAHFTDFTEEIEFQFTVKQSKVALFEGIYVLGTNPKSFLFAAGHKSGFASLSYDNVKARGRVRNIQLIDISRKDTYAGVCEDLSRQKGLKAEYCICKDFDDLLEHYPGIIPPNIKKEIEDSKTFWVDDDCGVN